MDLRFFFYSFLNTCKIFFKILNIQLRSLGMTESHFFYSSAQQFKQANLPLPFFFFQKTFNHCYGLDFKYSPKAHMLKAWFHPGGSTGRQQNPEEMRPGERKLVFSAHALEGDTGEAGD